MGMGSDMGGGSVNGSEAGEMTSGLGICCSFAACAQALVLAVTDCALGFARLPDCSPAPYGLSSAAHLQLRLLMCWAVWALLTLSAWHFLPHFSPICTAVSSQVC